MIFSFSISSYFNNNNNNNNNGNNIIIKPVNFGNDFFSLTALLNFCLSLNDAKSLANFVILRRS